MPEARKPDSDWTSEKDDGSDEYLLSEIRRNYDFDTDAFAEIRDEGATDVQYIANDPWPEKEKQNRRDNDRPLIACDQLNQYTNQVINEVRQHPREIKISAAGYGATAKLAEFRENRVRAIQYKSDAQAAYITAMENCVQRGYGYFRISLRYLSETSMDQEVCIKRLPNPDAVLFDAGCKELDCSDAQHCFVLDQISIKEFRREYPDAEIVDFSGDLAHDYPQWIKDKYIQIAEYWRVEKKRDTLVQFDGGQAGILTEALSKLDGAKIEKDTLIIPAIEGHPRITAKILNQRETKLPTIYQYITNGVEILKKTKWLGKWIPIVPIFGKELYITEAGGSKRLLLSLIRNARDAQMAYNYFKTCETEAVGMVPKTNYLAIEGQFEGHEEEAADANRNPKPYLYYKGFMPDAGAGQTLLPPPIREPFDPPIANLEAGADSFRQAIQTAVGMYNSSVGKNDTNVKSGKAIQELDAQSDMGAFHFLDNYNRGITAGGRIVNDLISKIEVTQRQVPIRSNDGTDSMVTINTPEPYAGEDGAEHHYPMELGEYDVTISVSPSADSQRDEASDFLETFISELGGLGLDPGTIKSLLAQSIKLKQLGPIGDAMADTLEPPPGDPAQIQGQNQQLQQQVQGLSEENQALHMDRAGRVLEQQTKVHIEGMKGQNKLDTNLQTLIVSLIKAELAAKSRSTDIKAESDAEAELEKLGMAHDAAHDVAMNTVQHNQAQELQAGQQQAAQQSQAADQVHQQSMAQNQPQNSQ